jgi:hypothetical protein
VAPTTVSLEPRVVVSVWVMVAVLAAAAVRVWLSVSLELKLSDELSRASEKVELPFTVVLGWSVMVLDDESTAVSYKLS